ncbi:zf-HC2 domain-containing protein [Streptomyces sp. KL2]|uniref:zf-HC2 domain-containing protein n=1 Tax=Streptomyces sp. KL2 TaxID=3050126 RepID=UPI00397C16C2
MPCSHFRTALSARVDGEALPPDVTGPALDAHLASCARCRRWEESARRLRQAALTADSGDTSGADRLLARLRTDSRAGAEDECEWGGTQAG